MKLNKTVLAVAIAGIAAAPMMASATTTLGGNVQIQISEEKIEDGDAATNTDANITNGDVNMNFAGSHPLNSGLTGYGNLRIDLDSTSGGTPTTDQTWVGIKGGFGDFRFGEVPNSAELGQAFDLHDLGTGINEGISYTGAFGGATVGLSYSPDTDQDVLGVGAKFSWNGLGLGVGMQDDGEQNIAATASFAYAGASIALQYGSLGASDETVVGAKVGYSISGVSLALTFSQLQDDGETKVRFNAGYDLGGGMSVSTEINQASDSAANPDSSDWRLRLAKSF